MERKYFITKYALKLGIKEVFGTLITANSIKVEENFGHSLYFNNDFHGSIEEAIKDANARKDKKIKSLKAQLNKLEKVKF